MADLLQEFPRFIVGMPRSGTTWLCQILNQNPDVAAFGETMFWGRSFVAPGPNGLYAGASMRAVQARLLAKPLETTIFIAGPGMMSGVAARDIKATIRGSFDGYDDIPSPGRVFSRIAGGIARAEGKRIWVEKTPHHIYHLRRILKFLPSARFVIMIRNPYSFISSYKHEPGYVREGQRMRHSNSRFHPIMPAIVWTRCWHSTLKAIRDMPDRVMVVRQEDVDSDPLGVLRRVESFFMLAHNPAVQGAREKINSSFDDAPRPTLLDVEIAWMNLISNQQIGEAGYEVKRVSLRPRAWWDTLAELPAWAFQFVRAKTTDRWRSRRAVGR